MNKPSPSTAAKAVTEFVDGLATIDYAKCLPLLHQASRAGMLDLSAIIDEVRRKLVTEVLNGLGSYLRKAGRRKEALLLYEAATRSGVDVRLNLANLLSEDPAQRPRAKSLYEEVLASGDNEALNNLAQLLTEDGDARAAESIYLKAIKSGDTLAWRNYALFLLEENRITEAEAQLRKLASLYPEVGERPLADLLALRGRWRLASDYYRREADRGGELPPAIKQAVRRHERRMPVERVRRSLRQSGSKVPGSLEYSRLNAPKVVEPWRKQTVKRRGA